MIQPSSAGTAIVLDQLIRRYSNPSRVTFMYLFHLALDADFSGVVPPAESILTAWLDEGNGFIEASPTDAVQRCNTIRQLGLLEKGQRRLTSTERRQMMSRTVQISLDQKTDDLIIVHLASKAITFSPKGDREVYEHWHLGSTGWYSAHRPDGNTTEV